MSALDIGERRAPLHVPARRPRVVLVDVYETMLRVDGLRSRFVDVGRAGHECELFLVRVQRDGMALTLAGGMRPFAQVARAALRSVTGHRLGEDALDHVLAGFRELPPHPDVEPALRALARARVPAYALTAGPADVACAALDRAGLRTYLRDVLSTEEVRVVPPPPRAYHWAAQQVESPLDRVGLLSVHPWDVHGAVRAGLVGGLATRLEGAVPDVVARPHAVADELDELVDEVLALPA